MRSTGHNRAKNLNTLFGALSATICSWVRLSWQVSVLVNYPKTKYSAYVVAEPGFPGLQEALPTAPCGLPEQRIPYAVIPFI